MERLAGFSEPVIMLRDEAPGFQENSQRFGSSHYYVLFVIFTSVKDLEAEEHFATENTEEKIKRAFDFVRVFRGKKFFLLCPLRLFFPI